MIKKSFIELELSNSIKKLEDLQSKLLEKFRIFYIISNDIKITKEDANYIINMISCL